MKGSLNYAEEYEYTREGTYRLNSFIPCIISPFLAINLLSKKTQTLVRTCIYFGFKRVQPVGLTSLSYNWVIFGDFAQTGSNWFLLILQTAKLLAKKECFCYAFQDWWVENLFCLEFDNGCLAEG